MKEQLIAKIEAAYDKAAGRNNTGDMLTATHQLLEIWLQEAGRYAQVHAAPGPTPGQCTCGAEELPTTGCAAGTSELHSASNSYSWNGDESV